MRHSTPIGYTAALLGLLSLFNAGCSHTPSSDADQGQPLTADTTTDNAADGPTSRALTTSDDYYQLASQQAEAEQWHHALGTVKQGLKNNKKNAQLWLLQGVAQRHLGQFDAALKSYKQSLKLDPEWPLPHYNLGVLYDLYLNNPKQAVHHFEAYQAQQTPPNRQVNMWLVELKRRASASH